MVEALGRIAADHTDSLCRESAVAALGIARAGPSRSPIVLAACADRATVRRRAVLALAAFRRPGGDSTMLRTMTADRDLQVRQAAEELLAIDEVATGEW